LLEQPSPFLPDFFWSPCGRLHFADNVPTLIAFPLERVFFFPKTCRQVLSFFFPLRTGSGPRCLADTPSFSGLLLDGEFAPFSSDEWGLPLSESADDNDVFPFPFFFLFSFLTHMPNIFFGSCCVPWKCPVAPPPSYDSPPFFPPLRSDEEALVFFLPPNIRSLFFHLERAISSPFSSFSLRIHLIFLLPDMNIVFFFWLTPAFGIPVHHR